MDHVDSFQYLGFSQVRYGGNIGETQFHWLTGEDLDQKLSSESTSGQLHSAINIAAHVQEMCFDTCPADPPRKGTARVVSEVVSEFDMFASSTDNFNIIAWDHLKMNVAFVGNNEHFDIKIWCHCVPDPLAWYLQ